MKICVFGAGAVGGTLAARLAQAGHDVCVVARGDKLAVIRERGLTIESGDERLHQYVKASDDAADLGAQDVVISTLKASSLPALADGIAPLLKDDSLVVFAQNGIPWWYSLGATKSSVPVPDLTALDPEGRLARMIREDSIVGAVVYSANTVIAPGVIENASPQQNRISLSTIDNTNSPRLTSLRQALIDASIKSPDVANIRQEIWQKLLSNIVTGMTVLFEEPTSAMMADTQMRRIAERLVAETTAVAAAYGIEVKPLLPNVPVGKKSSILQDYEQGRPMEVEAQFLAPLAFAHAAGVPAPTLDAVATMVAHKAAAKGLFQVRR